MGASGLHGARPGCRSRPRLLHSRRSRCEVNVSLRRLVRTSLDRRFDGARPPSKDWRSRPGEPLAPNRVAHQHLMIASLRRISESHSEPVAPYCQGQERSGTHKWRVAESPFHPPPWHRQTARRLAPVIGSRPNPLPHWPPPAPRRPSPDSPSAFCCGSDGATCVAPWLQFAECARGSHRTPVRPPPTSAHVRP